MPLYEYQCESCSFRFEHLQRMDDPPPTVCTQCGHVGVRRLVSSPAFQFKGQGWYVTDYARSGSAESKGSGGGDGDSGGDGGTESSAKLKTDTKAESKGEKTAGSGGSESAASPAASPAPPKSSSGSDG